MKLISLIITRISTALMILMAAWAVVFYYIVIDEINDETDDALENYSEYLITRALAGEELPAADNGTNNSYYINDVSEEYARANKGVRYSEEMVWIGSKDETEPARILKTIFRDDNDRYRELTVLIPTIEKSDLTETILWWIVILYFALLCGVIAVNVWVLRKSLRPLYALLDWIDGFTVGKELAPLENNPKVSEFRKLNSAVYSSATRNNEIFEQQKTFIGNASHEMQTPLAIIQNRLEMLAQSPDITEQQLENIAKTRQAAEYMVKLNRSLLLLARIESGQFNETRPININWLVRNALADYEEIYAGRDISLSVEGTDELVITMNETLASVLLNNLLKNAYAHTPKGGSIVISIDADRFSICNTAENGPLDKEHIFDRFYQGHKKEGFTGLGLALAYSVSQIYGLSITYDYTVRMHCFGFRQKK